MLSPHSTVSPPTIPGPIRRVILSHGLAALGMSVAWPLLLLLVWHESHSDLLLGLAGAARMLPYVMFSWATGRLADRYRRDRVVRWTLYARLVLLTLMAACLALGSTWAAVLAATAAVAVATPAFPALAAAMPSAAPTCRERATDLLVTVEVASFVVGPAIGGALLASRTQPLVPLAAVGLVVAASVLFVGVRLPHLTDTSISDGPKVLPVLRRSRELRGAIAVVCVLNAGIAAMSLVLLPFAEQAWSDGGTAFGIATAALGFGALAAPLLYRVGNTSEGRVRAGLLLLGLCLLLILPAPTVAFAVLPLALAGAANVHAESAATSVMQEHTPDALRASVLGLADTAMISTAMVVALVTPALVSVVGPSVLIGLVSLSMVAACRCVKTSTAPAVASAVATRDAA